MSDQSSNNVGNDSIEYMLTTVDNPFNPFTEFREWLTWDDAHHYHTTQLLARVTFSSDELSDADQSLAVQQGIDEVVRENVSGMHRKVSRFDFADSR